MPYTADKPNIAARSDDLRARIPGWGVDLDPNDRPSFPQEQFDPNLSGAHWTFPERQEEKRPRERSVEHLQLTPVFGTSAPPKGLSGVIRKFAYRRYSEARAAHWLLLMGADRIDALEEHLRSLASTRPDNPVTQTGIRSELTHGGIRSRVGHRRVDLTHQPLDPVIAAGPWVAAGGAAFIAARRLARALRRRG